MSEPIFKAFPTFHSHPQSLDSASTPEDFVKREIELGTGTLTCTDHGSLAACKHIYDLAKENDLIPIIGYEGYFRDDSCPIFYEANIPRNKNGSYVDYFKYGHFTTHCQDYEAYLTLVKLVSNAADNAEKHGQEAKPIFGWNELEHLCSKNVTLGSGCLIGLTARHLIQNNNPEIATKYYERLRSIVKPGNFYAEIFPHDCSKNWVSGLYITLANGEELKVHNKKVLKTNISEEIYAIDLLKEFKSKHSGGHTTLIAIKDRSKWTEKGIGIKSVEFIEEFIDNECSPLYPDGDVQAGANRFVIELAKKYNDPLIISDDSHFAYPELKPIQDVRLMSGGGSWRMYGCFEASTPVDMADGSQKRICDINIGDIVKSYDFENRTVVDSTVTATIPSDSNVNDFVSNKFFRYGGKGNRKIITSTKNHLFWDGSNWTKITEAKRASIRASKPNKVMVEILNGTMLGDGGIALAGRHRDLPYFTYGHSEKQSELTTYIAKALKTSISVINKKSGFSKTPFYKTSSAHPYFSKLHDDWYHTGEKQVPKDLEITPLTLAWWYMDDGSRCWSKRKDRTNPNLTYESTHLYTNGFSEESVNLLLSKLQLLGLSGRKYNRGTGWYIIFSKKEGRKLQNMVAPYILSSCKYKLYKEETVSIDPRPSFIGEDIYSVSPIVSVEHPKTSSGEALNFNTKYDIEVSDYHCFFVNGILVHNSYHRYSSQDAFKHFRRTLGIEHKEFEGIVENNINWSQKFKDFKFDVKPSLPKSFYPQDTVVHLKTLIDKHGRMDWKNSEYRDRLKREIDLFRNNNTMDLLPYFFMAEDICSFYHSKGMITGPGRGSASGALVSYLLGITHADPIKYGLSLERFITLDRIRSGKLPDIDMDFGNKDELTDPEIGFLVQRYGKENVAQVSTDVLLKLRSSVKDVHRALYKKVPFDVEELTKNFKNPKQGIDDRDFVFGYESDGGWEAGSIEYDDALKAYVKDYPKEWALAQRLISLGRAKSRHASAFVVADTPISDFIPTMNINGIKCTQYTATTKSNSVESVGGIKIDLLTVNSLNDISCAIKLVQERSGLEIPNETVLNNKKVPHAKLLPHKGKFYDIWELDESPYSKEVIEELIATGDTETVFQFGTGGAMKWLKYFDQRKPNGDKVLSSLRDMAIFTALDRPGPLDAMVTDLSTGKKHNMLVEYANRAAGKPRASGVEAFDGLIPETHDLLVTQESVQRIYQHFTGCTLSEAEEFRSIVAKKKNDKMIEIYPYFIEKASQKIGKERSQQVWEAIKTFANYSFNFSHALNYSQIGLASAYLKYYFPLEWWTSVLRNAKKEEINNNFWIHCGHLINLPDINRSQEFFAISDSRIQAPISLLDGIGQVAHKEICKYRPYDDITDFCRKIQQHKINNKTEIMDPGTGSIKVKMGHSALNKGIVYKLIISGCMDSLFPKTVEENGILYELSVVDKLNLYEKALAETREELLPVYDKKGNIKKQKPDQVDSRYLNINEIMKYQLRKEILPAYTTDIVHLLYQKVEGVEKLGDGYLFKDKKDTVPFVNFVNLTTLDNVDPFPEGKEGLKVAVAAYVEEARTFKYHGYKEAIEFILDIGGGKCHNVKWPGKDGKVLDKFKQIKEKTVVVAILQKFEEGRPFAISNIITAFEPLNLEKEGKNDNTGTSEKDNGKAESSQLEFGQLSMDN